MMKTFHVGRVLAVAAMLFAVPPVSSAQSTGLTVPAVLDFEALSAATGCGDNIFSSYGGLVWSGFGVIPSAECGGDPSLGDPFNGYHYGRTSGRKVGYVIWPTSPDPYSTLLGTIAVPSGHFSLLDGWLTAAWTRRLHVTVAGFRGPTMIGIHSLLLDYDAPVFVNFGFTDVTSVTFAAGGGTVDYNLAGISNNLVLDDLRVAFSDPTNVVPEPATLALFAPGLALIAAVRRRRQRRA